MKSCFVWKSAVKGKQHARIISAVCCTLPFHPCHPGLFRSSRALHGPKGVPIPERTKGITGPFPREGLVDQRLDLSEGRPRQDNLQALEYLFENGPAHMFDHQVHRSLARDFANLCRLQFVRRINHMVRSQRRGKRTLLRVRRWGDLRPCLSLASRPPPTGAEFCSIH